MRRPNYTEAEREHAMGALMACAVMKNGELTPNFSAVAKELGINKSTLWRWWGMRDRHYDKDRKAGVAHAVEHLSRDGALQYLEAVPNRVAAMLHWVTDPQRLEGRTVERNGRTVVIEPVPRVNDTAKAAQIVLQVHGQCTRLVEGRGQVGDNTFTTVERRLQETGLLKRLVSRDDDGGGDEEQEDAAK